MIKFFRKIRQNLLMENKMGKYFKYAIGEIVLVVIGILIALQINNWNEQRKKDILKKEYKTALLTDYVKDTTELGERLKLNKSNLVSLDSMIDKFNENKTDKEILNSLRQIGFPIGSRLTNAYNTNSFNLLISSGNIDLFDKNLRKEIMELNRLQDYEKQVSKSNKTIYFENVANISRRYPVYNKSDGFSEKITDKAWKSIHLKTLYIDVINFYSFRRYMSDRYIQLTGSIQEQTKKVINLLNEKYD